MRFYLKNIDMRIITKIIALVFLLMTLNGCQSLKDGLQGNKKSKNAEEFLIEKKNPLVLPPDYSKLPTQISDENLEKESNFEIQDILVNKDNTNVDKEVVSSQNNSLENSILKKIKDN